LFLLFCFVLFLFFVFAVQQKFSAKTMAIWVALLFRLLVNREWESFTFSF
jgi:hypothetical protein